MDYEIRPATEDEFVQFPRVFGTAFGFQPGDDDVARWRAGTELDRTLAAFDGDTIVGTAGAYSFELTVPGPASVPAAGVTAVSVRATHRRRGITSAVMRRQLSDVRERGEPVAILLASESAIYGRFGYGWATSHLAVELETDRSEFVRPVDDGGRIVQADADMAAKAFPSVYDTFRRLQPGQVTRPKTYWDELFRDPEHERRGASGLFYAVHESAKRKADGYLAYRVKNNWPHGLPGNEINLVELVAPDATTYAALWRYALDIDLAGKVVAWGRPVDEPIRWRLKDPRRLRTTILGDYLWARILDVPAALEARRYTIDGELVLDVTDPFTGMATGRFRLEGGPAGATVKTTKKKADLAMTASELGSIYLGGVSASTLARAGRIDELTKGALAKADAMFVTHPAPYCISHF